MGDPGLLQKAPHIPALLSERGGDREQSAPADPTGSGLDAIADLAVNHGLAQCPLGGVVGRLDPWRLQERPERLATLHECRQVRTV